MDPKTSIADSTVDVFLRELASAAPTPGGGAAAAVMGAIGAALVGMVASLTIGKKSYAQHQDLSVYLVNESGLLREHLLRLADEDAAAYSKYRQAAAMPKDTPDQIQLRKEAMQQALVDSTLVPMEIMEVCDKAMSLVAQATGHTNQNLASDLQIAQQALQTAASAARENIMVNLPNIEDKHGINERLREIEKLRIHIQ